MSDELYAVDVFNQRPPRAFIPQIWIEALHRNIIQSLGHSEVVALSVHYEREARVSQLKRRNTRARRRRRATIKREKRAMNRGAQ